MKNLNLIFCIGMFCLTAACSSKVDQGTEASDAKSQPETPVEQAKQEIPAVCIWKEIGVRETPQEKGKYITSIYLGEKVTAMGDTASEVVGTRKYLYERIRLIDGKEGWVRSDFVAVDAVPAAMLKEATIYKRPDIMTSSGKSFNQMDFVAVRNGSSSGEWSEVIGKRMGDTWFTSGWVRSENLTTQPTDVAFSVFYVKAMELDDEDKRDEAIQQLLRNTDLSSSSFYTAVLSEHGGEGEEEYYEEAEDY